MASRSDRPAERQSAFTLIELLFAIGLIAILLGLLMPALGRARNRARETACQSNLAQIYHGLQLYRNDYNDYLPRKSNQSDLGWSPHYGAAVARYMVSRMPLTWQKLVEIRALHCPSSQFPGSSATYVINAFRFDQDQSFMEPRYAHPWRWIVAAKERLPLLMDSPPQGLGVRGCPEEEPLSLSYPDGIYNDILQATNQPKHLNPSSQCNRVGHDAHGRARCNVLFASGEVRRVDIRAMPLEQFDDGIRGR